MNFFGSTVIRNNNVNDVKITTYRVNEKRFFTIMRKNDLQYTVESQSLEMALALHAKALDILCPSYAMDFLTKNIIQGGKR
jgi:hypothetical protein